MPFETEYRVRGIVVEEFAWKDDSLTGALGGWEVVALVETSLDVAS